MLHLIKKYFLKQLFFLVILTALQSCNNCKKSIINQVNSKKSIVENKNINLQNEDVKKIKVALFLPLSGKHQQLGTSLANSATLSLFENKESDDLELLFFDSGDNPKESEKSFSEIAKQVGTPFYCYSRLTLFENYQNFVDAFAGNKISDYKICYAIKANYNFHLVKILADLGAGIDAVSAGEIHRAIKAGINPKKIVFAGVGKTREDLTFALQNGVEEFSVESAEEMFLLNEVASNLHKIAKFSLRVNPDVDAKTHHKISTGRKGDKFGVDIDLVEEIYALASKLPSLEIYGISMHIGSQITNLEPFKIAFDRLRKICQNLIKKGFKIKNLDFGGGVGINYQNDKTINIYEYIKLIKETIQDLDVKVTIAPGRAIVGDAGLLITKVIYLNGFFIS